MGMKDLREPGIAERFTCTYWEAVITVHRATGGIVGLEAIQTIATIYGRDFKQVAADLERGAP